METGRRGEEGKERKQARFTTKARRRKAIIK
jgi:hypothetical protein